MKVKLTFTNKLLGSCPNDADLYRNWIANDVPTEVADKEVKALPQEQANAKTNDIEAKGTSVFRRTSDNVPALADYTIKGFFKDAASMLARIGKDHKLVAHKKIIDGLIFVHPRLIELTLPEGDTVGHLVRPLRAHTAQGERVSLARSESVPEGTTCELEIRCLDEKLEDVVLRWLDYGEARGLGQWRNSGKGTFTYKETAESIEARKTRKAKAKADKDAAEKK